MLIYHFVNQTTKQICVFDNNNGVIMELKRACVLHKGWLLHHSITVEADKTMVDYLVIQKDYEFLGY